MATVIENGVGNADKLKINGRNEALTFAVTESVPESATNFGDAFNINTGDITSLTAGDATMIYFKNDETEDVHIDAVAFGLRGLTALTDMAVVTFIRNPTGGNLISDATAVSMNQNRNFGSAKTLASTSLVFKGKAAGTVTGGDDIIQVYAGNNTRSFITIDMVLPRGSSIAVKVVSDASAGTVYCALIMHKKDSIR